MAVIGVDLGGTKLAGVLLDDDGCVLDQAWIGHTVAMDRNAIAVLGDGIDRLRRSATVRGHAVRGIGVSIAGWLDVSRSHVVHAANLALSGVALQIELEGRHDLPVRIGNDGDCTLLGEHAAGAARGSHNAVLLTLGTGVGGAVLVDGRLLVGNRGIAGELGHLPVTTGGEICICGGQGCLEQQVSGAALARVAMRLAANGDSPHLVAVEGPVGARELGEAARAGDSAASRAIATAAEALAVAIRMLIPVTDPEVVVLGGSVSEGLGDLLLPQVTGLLASAPRPLAEHLKAPRVVTAAMTTNAAATGAAYLVLAELSPQQDIIEANR